MTALRFTESRKPATVSGPILPMDDEDRRFWQLLRQRRPELYEGRR